MEDFLNLHGINRNDIDLKEKEKAQRRQRGNKRNSRFVRSDALSPNSVNKLIIELPILIIQMPIYFQELMVYLDLKDGKKFGIHL